MRSCRRPNKKNRNFSDLITSQIEKRSKFEFHYYWFESIIISVGSKSDVVRFDEMGLVIVVVVLGLLFIC